MISGVIRAAYLAAEGFEAPLVEELARRNVAVSAWHGRLALSPDPPVAPAAKHPAQAYPAQAYPALAYPVWALDVWTAPREIEIPSVKAASDALRAVQRNWGALPVVHHRRMALIEERLPPVKARPLMFPELPPSSHLGAWTLLAPDRMLFSPAKTSPVVNGAWLFQEDRVGPPSRAYLKLWEACTRMGCWPLPGERCVDLGASPGGWTWAIARLGAQVVAVDKAPLDPAVAAMPGVTERRESAFGIEPEPVDWLFSDVIAYPARLLALVRRWIGAGAAKRIVCTIKLQGETDHAAVEEFAAIPGAVVTHLFSNKHELTVIWSCE